MPDFLLNLGQALLPYFSAFPSYNVNTFRTPSDLPHLCYFFCVCGSHVLMLGSHKPTLNSSLPSTQFQLVNMLPWSIPYKIRADTVNLRNEKQPVSVGMICGSARVKERAREWTGRSGRLILADEKEESIEDMGRLIQKEGTIGWTELGMC